MKKTLVILLAAVMVLMGGVFTVSAEDKAGEEPIYTINIDDYCTMLWAGKKPEFSIRLDAETLKKVDIVSEKWIGPNELTVSGDNIAIEGGKYKYQLKLSAKEGFVFDNDLKINYKGIDSKYKLHYDFPPEDGNHTMIVTGDFDNIIAASPLIDKIDIGKVMAEVISGNYTGALDYLMDDGVPLSDKVTVDGSSKFIPVSKDKYSYELVLKTKEGFSFKNNLQFLYDEDKYGYILDYDYDLSKDRHTLKIRGTVEKKKDTPAGSDDTETKSKTSAKTADKTITSLKNDKDPKGAVFSKIKLKSPKQTSKSVTLKWTKNKKAVKYVIYGNRCGKGIRPKKLATVKGKTAKTFKKVAGRKIRKATYYKFIVVAVDRNNNVVSMSKMIHVATKGGKVGNHKSVKVSRTVIAKAKKLRKGKTLNLKAKAIAQSKKLKVRDHIGMRYESTNKKIATVSKRGKVTAKRKGSCYIYAYAQNGVYRKIKVTVK